MRAPTAFGRDDPVLAEVPGIFPQSEEALPAHPAEQRRDIGGVDRERPGDLGSHHSFILAYNEFQYIELGWSQPEGPERPLGDPLHAPGGRQDSEGQVHRRIWVQTI
jgi:hypothetical protein